MIDSLIYAYFKACRNEDPCLHCPCRQGGQSACYGFDDANEDFQKNYCYKKIKAAITGASNIEPNVDLSKKEVLAEIVSTYTQYCYECGQECETCVLYDSEKNCGCPASESDGYEDFPTNPERCAEEIIKFLLGGTNEK